MAAGLTYALMLVLEVVANHRADGMSCCCCHWLQMYSDMEAQLQYRQQRDGDVWLNPAGADGIAVSGGEAGGAVKR